MLDLHRNRARLLECDVPLKVSKSNFFRRVREVLVTHTGSQLAVVAASSVLMSHRADLQSPFALLEAGDYAVQRKHAFCALRGAVS